MKINSKHSPNFKSVNIDRLVGPGQIYVTDRKDLEKMSEGVDVILKNTKRNFPYRKTTMSVDAIKIIVRPEGLGFWSKLFGKQTVVDYFPFGNLKPMIEFDFKGTFMDFLKKTIAKVKK